MYIVDNKFFNKNINPTPFNMIRARSCHSTDTHNHNAIPQADKPKSTICNPSMPLIDIALNTKIDATHLIYQSVVCLGVADLKIRFELAISFGSYLISFINCTLH